MLNNKQQNRLKRLQGMKKSGESLNSTQSKRLKRLKNLRNGGGGDAGDGSVPVFKNTNKAASAVSKNVFNAANEQLQPVVENAFNPFDFDALPQAPNTQDLAGERKRIEDELYGNFTQDFEGDKAQERNQLEQSLIERGIDPGSGEQWQNELDRFDRGWQRRYDDARGRAVAGGGQELERSFGIGRLGRSDALGEQVLGREFGLNQLGNLMGIGSNPANIQLQYQQMKNSKNQAELDRQHSIKLSQMNRPAFHGGGVAPAPFDPSAAIPLPPPPGVL